MAQFSCSHSNQQKHTVSFASSYKHIITTSGRERVEQLFQTRWHWKWGVPVAYEVFIGTNRLYCN